MARRSECSDAPCRIDDRIDPLPEQVIFPGEAKPNMVPNKNARLFRFGRALPPPAPRDSPPPGAPPRTDDGAKASQAPALSKWPMSQAQHRPAHRTLSLLQPGPRRDPLPPSEKPDCPCDCDCSRAPARTHSRGSQLIKRHQVLKREKSKRRTRTPPRSVPHQCLHASRFRRIQLYSRVSHSSLLIIFPVLID